MVWLETVVVFMRRLRSLSRLTVGIGALAVAISQVARGAEEERDRQLAQVREELNKAGDQLKNILMSQSWFAAKRYADKPALALDKELTLKRIESLERQALRLRQEIKEDQASQIQRRTGCRSDTKCFTAYKSFRKVDIGMPTLQQLNVMRNIVRPDSPPYRTTHEAWEDFDANWGEIAMVVTDIWRQICAQEPDDSDEDYIVRS
ncbi:MAG: hypothetical protein LBJ42_00595 [Holosporales bacterium]|jgi:hypothetical protein|nr:hypothetical protein [Holosporales bacterium]